MQLKKRLLGIGWTSAAASDNYCKVGQVIMKAIDFSQLSWFTKKIKCLQSKVKFTENHSDLTWKSIMFKNVIFQK